MKIVRLRILAFGIIILFSCLLYGNQGMEAKPVSQQVRDKIEGREYIVEVTQMSPSAGRSRSLSSGYKIRLRNDSLFSVLPYVGVARNVPYAGGDGFVFDAPITDYKVEYDKKGVAQISFRTSHQGDHYTYRLSIFDNGSTAINITSTNRQFISYHGMLE